MSTALRQTDFAPSLAQDAVADDELIGIAEMARRFGTTYRTLRFYEQRGMLKAHREGVNRFYDEEAQRQFKLIEEGRQLGFTLSEIAGLLASSQSREELQLSIDTIAGQIDHLEAQRRQIDAALATLRKRSYLLGAPAGEDQD